MLTMIGKRLMFAIPSLIGVVIVTFLLTRALPGDPAAYFAGPAATKEAIEQIRKKLGLDKPLIEQFFRYVADLAHGDFGNSLTTGQPVATEIRNRLPASAELTLLGLVVSIVIAIPLGILAATRPGSWIDHLCRVRRRPACRCRCSSPGWCWSTSSISARLVAGAARAARRVLQRAADGDRLLSDRQR